MPRSADAAGAIALAIVAEAPAARAAAGELFPGRPQVILTRDELRPRVPFEGALFEALAGVTRGSCVGLFVPVLWRGPAGGAGLAAPGEAGNELPELVAVADHLNLEMRGPLTGPWPARVPRTFPPLTGIYQPGLIRARGGPRVYSSGIVLAGVAEAGRLSPFEVKAIRDQGLSVVADALIPPVIVAAYYGLTIAACGVLQAHTDEE